MVTAIEAEHDDEVILVTTVEIAPGFSRPIRLRRGDSTSKKALEFCEQYCLPADVAGPLSRHLQENIDKATGSNSEHDEPAESQRRQTRDSGGSAALLHSPPRNPRACQNGLDESTVFDRLYSLAQQRRHKMDHLVDTSSSGKQQSKASASKSGTSTKKLRGKFENYGEYLYIEGLASLEQRKQLSQTAHEEQEERELEGLSFTPEILEKSRAMCSAAPVWQRLTHTAPSASAVRKRAMYKAESEKDLQECTFQPKINNKSNTMMSQRQATLQQLSMSTYDKLYNDAQLQEDRLQIKKQQLGCNSDSDVAVVQHRASAHTGSLVCSMDSGSPRLPASDRLYAYELKKQAKLSRARQAQMLNDDGMPLFRPNTGRDPSEGEEIGRVPRWKSLYSLRNQAEEKRQQLKQQLEDEERQARSVATRINPKSEKLLTGLLHRRFEQIFEYLDPTHGFLDLLAVRNMPQFETLSMEISDDVESAAVILCADRGLCQGPIIARVLQSASERRVRILHAVTVLAERRLVGEESTDVNLPQFSELMHRVVRTNRIPTRTYLLPDIRAPSDTEENLTFKPEINVNSMELAQQRWQDWPRPVHEDLHQHAKTMQTRKEMRQKLKELELLSECTFQPELSSKSSFEQHRTLSTVSCQSGHSFIGDESHKKPQAQTLPSGRESMLEDLANMRIESFDESRLGCQ